MMFKKYHFNYTFDGHLIIISSSKGFRIIPVALLLAHFYPNIRRCQHGQSSHTFLIFPVNQCMSQWRFAFELNINGQMIFFSNSVRQNGRAQHMKANVQWKHFSELNKKGRLYLAWCGRNWLDNLRKKKLSVSFSPKINWILPIDATNSDSAQSNWFAWRWKTNVLLFASFRFVMTCQSIYFDIFEQRKYSCRNSLELWRYSGACCVRQPINKFISRFCAN